MSLKKILFVTVVFSLLISCKQLPDNKGEEESVPTSKLDALTSLESESDTVAVKDSIEKK
jgi:hypothetical protein